MSLSEAGLHALADWVSAGRLSRLSLFNSFAWPSLIARLGECPGARFLRRLDVSWTLAGEEGMRALAALPYLGGLTELRVGGRAGGLGLFRAMTDVPGYEALSGGPSATTASRP
jgi:hypothetical protein